MEAGPGLDRGDPDPRVEWIEDDSGGRFWIEVGGLLRHHLAGTGDRHDVGNGRRPEQKGGLSRAGFDRVEYPIEIAGVGQVTLLLDQVVPETENALQDLPMKHG